MKASPAIRSRSVPCLFDRAWSALSVYSRSYCEIEEVCPSLQSVRLETHKKLASAANRCYEWNVPRSSSWRRKSSAIPQTTFEISPRKKFKRILAVSDRHVLLNVESSSSAKILSLALAYASVGPKENLPERWDCSCNFRSPNANIVLGRGVDEVAVQGPWVAIRDFQERSF